MKPWKWNSSYDEDENLDWLLMRGGPIVKYHSTTVLQEHLEELAKLRYQVIDLSTSNWTRKNAHQKIKAGFNFPDYYGENIAAFDDCLSDMFSTKYPGLIIVLRNFDAFYSEDKNFADAILDSISRESWAWLLAGQKLISLVQSKDPHLEINKIGGVNPGWNGSEWLDARRIGRKNKT